MLTRERKLYAGILGLAALGLALDKLLLGASSPAEASAAIGQPEQDARAAGGTSAAPVAGAVAGAHASTGPSLAQRLRAASAAVGPTRSLSHTPDWLAAPAPARAPVAEGVSPGEPKAPKPPLARVQLSTTLGDGERASSIGPAAVIDGRLVRVGEAYGPLRLVAVGRGTAVFAEGETLWQVTADDPVLRPIASAAP